MDGIRPQDQDVRLSRTARPPAADRGEGAPEVKDTFQRQDRDAGEIRVTSFGAGKDREPEKSPTKEPGGSSCSETCGEVCDCGGYPDATPGGGGTAGKVMTAAGVGGAFAGGAVG